MGVGDLDAAAVFTAIFSSSESRELPVLDARCRRRDLVLIT